jgi:transcriptional regulator with XRE-family HTH domain
MKKATLATAFAEIRGQNGLSMLAIANKCGISETTVWKIEHGLSVRWETVHLVLTIGLGVHAGTDRYAAFQALWVKGRQEMAESQAPDFGTKRMPAHAVAAVRKFRKLVHDLDKERVSKALAAAQRAVRQSDRQSVRAKTSSDHDA